MNQLAKIQHRGCQGILNHQNILSPPNHFINNIIITLQSQEGKAFLEIALHNDFSPENARAY